MGTQIHAGDNYRRVVELIQAGAIGPVREAHVWVVAGLGPAEPRRTPSRISDIVSVHGTAQGGNRRCPPASTGTCGSGRRRQRPFHDVYLPGPKWYRWWDFGNGTMSDLGSHWIDLPFWALKLDAPLTVEAAGPPAASGDRPGLACSATLRVRPARRPAGGQADVVPGRRRSPSSGSENDIPQWGNGVLFVGAKGMLLSDYGKHVLLPEKDFADFKRPAKTSFPTRSATTPSGFDACKTGGPTTCHFELLRPG